MSVHRSICVRPQFDLGLGPILLGQRRLESSWKFEWVLVTRDTFLVIWNRVLRIINRNRWWCNSDSVPGTFPKVDCVYFLNPGVHFYHRLNVYANKCTLIMITCFLSVISQSFYFSFIGYFWTYNMSHIAKKLHKLVWGT